MKKNHPERREKTRFMWPRVAIVSLLSVGCPLISGAVEPAKVVSESPAPMQDPWVPPALRKR